MKIFITGATGVLGQVTNTQLIQAGVPTSILRQACLSLSCGRFRVYLGLPRGCL